VSYAGGVFYVVAKAQFALLDYVTVTFIRVSRHNRSVGTVQDAGVAADALAGIEADYSVLLCERAGNTRPYALRFVAMAAGHREVDSVISVLNLYARYYVLTFKVANHIAGGNAAEISVSAVILAKVTAETPVLIDKYSFHTSKPPSRATDH
jgi:hypothetical protein